MKTRKPSSLLWVAALAAGLSALVANSAYSQTVLYANTNGNQNLDYNYAGNGNNQIGSAGNEVILAGTAASDLVTSLQFQFDLESIGPSVPSGLELVKLTLYENNGPLVNNAYSPQTVLYDSGYYTLSSLGVTSFTAGSTITFNTTDLGGGVVVPQDFTWAVTFNSIPNTELAGLSMYSPPSVGQNYGDAWVNPTGTPGNWSLLVASPPNPPLEFGVSISGTAVVPEPSTYALMIGAIGLGFLFRRKLLAA